jgi:hypothetical protein
MTKSPPPIRRRMSMSLDGFIAGPDDRAGQQLGRNEGRLFSRLGDRMSDDPSGQVFCELMATGAVIAGRRTFELAGRWQGDHHKGAPIFVLRLEGAPRRFIHAWRVRALICADGPAEVPE